MLSHHERFSDYFDIAFLRTYVLQFGHKTEKRGNAGSKKNTQGSYLGYRGGH
ncbi:hypothetical protein LV92_02013 [Arenibacter echinorum]|uniref:Uncharacterized protein n=1 Tax=Arenibacter echinorum TaxID=440515 RepID=A0A327RG46_9FLAO|nr:hypothetical protein LV92_02013 [Arenibacter echinorum]